MQLKNTNTGVHNLNPDVVIMQKVQRDWLVRTIFFAVIFLLFGVYFWEKALVARLISPVLATVTVIPYISFYQHWSKYRLATYIFEDDGLVVMSSNGQIIASVNRVEKKAVSPETLYITSHDNYFNVEWLREIVGAKGRVLRHAEGFLFLSPSKKGEVCNALSHLGYKLHYT